MIGTSLTGPQQQVLTMLSTGSTIQSAAESVGVHRNTIANWRRSLPAFRESWADMLEEQAIFWRDHLTPLAAIAFQNLEQILSDPRTPIAVRLRASLAVVKQVTASAPARAKRPAPNDSGVESLLDRFADSPSPYAYRPSAQPRAAESTPKPAAGADPAPDLCTEFAEDAQLAQPPAPRPDASPDPAAGPSSNPSEAELLDLLEEFITPPRLNRH